jgi:hypothetical protein
MGFLIVTLLACSSDPPFISEITPEKGAAGDQITLIGQNLSDDYGYALAGVPLEALSIADAGRATATVPAGLPTGPVDLSISGGRNNITIGGLFSVAEPLTEDPCDPSVRRMTHIPSTADVVKIDLYRGEEVERTQLSTREIERIEYEARVDEAGAYCSSIWLKTRGGRVLFDADRVAPLRKQAQKIANGLGRPIEIIHEDEFPKPSASPEPAVP